MQPEIKLVRNHVEIHMPNGDFYRITCGENAITVNLQSDEGTMLIKPNVSNEVKITSIDVYVN